MTTPDSPPSPVSIPGGQRRRFAVPVIGVLAAVVAAMPIAALAADKLAPPAAPEVSQQAAAHALRSTHDPTVSSTPVAVPTSTTMPAPPVLATPEVSPTSFKSPTARPRPVRTTQKPRPSKTTKPTSKPAPTNGSAAGNGSFERKVLVLVNKERSKAGLRPLKGHSCLAKWAEKWSATMARTKQFKHQSLGPMGRDCGTPYVGENIAMGPLTPESVMRMWMKSPGHRANILRKSYTHIGIGWVKSSNGYGYATQDFMGR